MNHSKIYDINESSLRTEDKEDSLYVMNIIEDTTVDGPGLRTSIYAAGCSHKCKGCHNPESWNINNGKKYMISDLKDRIIELNRNVTFTGGDPFYQYDSFYRLASYIKKETNKNIWCYTGYTFEELITNENFRKLLELIDVLVDGRFVNELKQEDIIFKGSENQRIINVKDSLLYNKVILYNYNPFPEF